MSKSCPKLVGEELTTLHEIIGALGRLKDIPAIMVSMGKDGSLFRYNGRLYRCHGLKVEVADTIGCGDALLSGLLYGFETKMDTVEMLKLATAVSAAAAMVYETVGFNKSALQSLKEQVRVEMIG